jgi:hypothetical protein
LEKFFHEKNEKHKIDALMATFMGLWGLENNDDDTNKIVKKAIENPDDFVLKAQMGSGKGNFFGPDVKRMLTEMDIEQRSAYTLMQKIHPISVKVWRHILS